MSKQSLHYIQKKLTHQEKDVKSTLEKLEKIIELVKDRQEIDLVEGKQEIQALSVLINTNLATAKTKYLQ